jgi:hypothetical protein
MDDKMTAEQITEKMMGDYARFARDHPKLYRDSVRKGSILDIMTQEKISEMGKEEFLDFIMCRQTSCALNVYSQYTTDVLKDLDQEIVESLENLIKIKEEDLSDLREKLVPREPMIELDDWGNFLYTRAQRRDGDVMMNGVEFRVTKAFPVDGPHIFTTWVGGFYGFLKFYREEVEQIAPKEANAYLMGTAWSVEIIKGKLWSPITAGNRFEINQEDGMYHVVPIKFFDVDVDKSEKYKMVSEILERDVKGNAVSFQIKLVPRTT